MNIQADEAIDTMEIQNIEEIQFGVLSAKEICEMSVAEITSNRFTDTSTVNSVYDPRMGPMKSGETCITCGYKTKQCPGHFGHINLTVNILHPLYNKSILAFLRCFCIKCSRLLITEEHLKLWNIVKYKKDIRFHLILEKLIKTRFCTHCNTSQPKYTYSTQEQCFYAQHKEASNILKLKLNTEDVQEVFYKVLDSDVELLGFNPVHTHPRNLILSVLPVLPPRSRPFIMNDNVICDDDLTIQYTEIVKTNNYLRSDTLSEAKYEKYIQTLKFRVKTMMDNTNGKARHTNSRQMKGIKERLTGKDGLIRNNLMGKRVNFSGRTVIGPDPTLRLNEIAIPHEIADTLTYPVNVNRYNLDVMQELILNDGANNVIRGDVKFILKYALQGEKRKTFKLKIGDIVERKLKDGDIILLNRQPTLHSGSMLAQRVIRRSGKTIRMNLAITSTFNADFDGDEMNLHTASSEMSRAELEMISCSENNMIGTQASKPVISIVQDALLGAYLMTKNKSADIGKAQFFHICMKIDANSMSISDILEKLCHIECIYKKYELDIPLYSGYSLISLLLPSDFMYSSRNNADESEPVFKIAHGVVCAGRITKSNLGSKHNSILHVLHKEYPRSVVFAFINNIQFVANEYLLYHGFSIGIEDCVSTKQAEIAHIVSKCFTEAEEIENITNNPFIRESKVNQALGKAKDIGMRIAKDALSSENNFVDTITSGSKGDFFNIAQIMGLLGQQNITGRRVQAHLNKEKRTLPHYPMDEMTKPTEYESKGFISHSFIRGLSPQEFWFHAMSGREGITDSAMKTSQSGYIQRKMVKILEDVQIKYDQSVRNSVNSVIQFAYGNDNMNPKDTVLVNSTPSFCDLNRLAERLNAQHELQK